MATGDVWCNLGSSALVDCTVAKCRGVQSLFKTAIVKECDTLPKVERLARGFRFMKKVRRPQNAAASNAAVPHGPACSGFPLRAGFLGVAIEVSRVNSHA